MNTHKQTYYIGVNPFGYAVPSFMKELRKDAVQTMESFHGAKWCHLKSRGWKIQKIVFRPVCPVCQQVRESLTDVGCCDECYA